MAEALTDEQARAIYAKLTPTQKNALVHEVFYGRDGWRIAKCVASLRKHGLVQEGSSLLTGAGMDMATMASRRAHRV